MHNTFDQFIKQLDRILVSKCGLQREDLPDTVMLYDYFEEDMSNKEFQMAVMECASAILEGAGAGDFGIE